MLAEPPPASHATALKFRRGTPAAPKYIPSEEDEEELAEEEEPPGQEGVTLGHLPPLSQHDSGRGPALVQKPAPAAKGRHRRGPQSGSEDFAVQRSSASVPSMAEVPYYSGSGGRGAGMQVQEASSTWAGDSTRECTSRSGGSLRDPPSPTCPLASPFNAEYGALDGSGLAGRRVDNGRANIRAESTSSGMGPNPVGPSNPLFVISSQQGRTAVQQPRGMTSVNSPGLPSPLEDLVTRTGSQAPLARKSPVMVQPDLQIGNGGGGLAGRRQSPAPERPELSVGRSGTPPPMGRAPVQQIGSLTVGTNALAGNAVLGSRAVAPRNK